MSGINYLNNGLQAIFGGMKVCEEGIWNYIKLPNGIAICWGVATATVACTLNGLGGYYHPRGVYTSFPSGLFIEVPVGIAVGYGDGLAQTVQARPVSRDQFYWNVLSNGSGTITYAAHLITIGRWK